VGTSSSAEPGAPGPEERPTLESVGRQARVSRQTVSNVLRAPERVAEETKQRVEAVIAATGYRPSRAARALRTGRSNLIAVSLGAADQDQVLDRFLHSLSAEAQGRGYHVLLAAAVDDAHEVRAYTDLLGEHDVDCVILTGTHAGDARARWLEQRGVNFVTFGRPWDSTSAHSWVDVDGASGTRQATAHLLRLGHDRVAFLGWPEGSGVGEDRRSGWEQACRAVGAPTGDLFRRMPNDLATARSACAALLEAGEPPTGFVCVSDEKTIVFNKIVVYYMIADCQ
jgi:DNA-binding LacI/PurR family transcriptional regulator